MLKNKLRVIKLGIIFIIFFLVLVTPVTAQDRFNPPLLEENSNQQIQPGPATQFRDEAGEVNWWWLLPLLLIPLGIWLLTRPKDRRMDRDYRQDVAYHDIDQTKSSDEEESEDQSRLNR